MDKTDYPLPEESLVKIVNSIFSPIKNKLCLTCFFVEGGGRRTLINYFLQDKKFIKKIFGSVYNKILFIYVNPDEIVETTSNNYLSVLLNNITNKIKQLKITPDSSPASSVFTTIKKNLELLISKNYYIVFLLNDFEFLLNFPETLFRNLESILSVNKNQINFVFFSTVNLLDENILRKFHNFKYAITQRYYYHPLLSKEESDYILNAFEKKLSININLKIKNLLINLCGGHPQLLKYSFYLLKENSKILLENETKIKDFIINNYQLKNVCFDIWQKLNNLEKEILISVSMRGVIPNKLIAKSHFLIETGIIQPTTRNKYKVFGQFFNLCIQQQIPKEKLIYDKETDQIFFGGRTYGHKFTKQEYKLLIFFLSHENRVISRDEIGQILWGKNYLEQYSDWSIDKIISVLRKKLSEIGFSPQNLTTLKRRGFSFSNP